MTDSTSGAGAGSPAPAFHDGELKAAFQGLDESERRSNIERIVTSYRHPWDVYAELVQNAIDAINEQAELLPDGEFLGDLRLTIDTAHREICISDNGRGIPSDQIGALIATAKSLKRGKERRLGFMGFGLTFVAFQTSYLRIESVHDGKKSVRTYHDLFKYVFSEDLVALPEADENKAAPATVDEENGTTITLQFPLKFPRPERENDLSEAFRAAVNSDLLVAALRTKTAIGNVDKLFGRKPRAEVVVHLNVDGSEREAPFKFLDYAEVLAEMGYLETQSRSMEQFERLVEETKDEPREMQLKRRQAHPAIFYKEEDTPLDPGETIKMDVYIFASSKRNFTKFNSDVLKVDEDASDDGGGTVWGVNTGVILALDGMPTSIRLDAWTHGGYLPYSVLVNVRNMSRDLDAGRKGISFHRRKQIMDSIEALLLNKNFRRYQKYVTGASEAPKPFPEERSQYIKDFEATGKAFSPKSAICLPCTSEQEVIALFYELVGAGKLHGYKTKMLSSNRTYDALIGYDLASNSETLYDRENNRLGVLRNTFEEKDGHLTADALLEFKWRLEELYTDMVRVGHPKDFNEIDILVCWSVDPTIGTKYGDIISSIAPNERYFFGATHQITMASRSRPLHVMALKDLLELL